MKVFNVNKLKFTLAGLCGSVMLVGCVGENADNKSTVSNSGKIAQSAQNLHNVNDENKLWTVITGSDGFSYDSDLKFGIDNQSGETFEFVGCTDMDGFTPKFESPIFYSGGSTTRVSVSDHDPRKNLIDFNGTGIYESTALNKTKFEFHVSSFKDNKKAECYFKLYDDSRDNYMYFKLVNDARQFNTMSSLFIDMKKPLEDAQSVASSLGTNIWAERAFLGSMNIASTNQVFKYMAGKYGMPFETAVAKFADSIIDDLVSTSIAKYNFMRTKWLSLPEGARKERLFAEIKNTYFNPEGSALWDINYQRLGGNDEAVKIALRNFKVRPLSAAEISANLAEDPQFARRAMLIDLQGNEIIPGRAAGRDVWARYGFAEGKYMEGFTMSNYKQIVDLSTELERNTEGMFKRVKNLENFLSPENSVNFRALAKTAGTKGAKAIKTLNTPSYLRTGIVVGSTLFSFAFDWFVVQPLLEGLLNEPGYGTSWTGINMLSLEEVTDNDVNTWNKLHPDNKIEANTAVHNDEKNNSILSQSMLSFKSTEGDSDRNKVIQVTLSKITNPWLRLDTSHNDPWLGDVGKLSKNKGSAVFQMSLSSADSTLVSHDTSNEVTRLYYGEMGLNNLSSAALPAPKIAVIQQSVASSGRLLQSGNGLLSYGGISGFFVNSGSTAKLSVSIPETTVGNQVLSGTQYNAHFVEETTSESDVPTIFNTVRSKKLYNELEQLSEPLLLTRFGCNAFTKTGQACELDLGISKGTANSGKRMKGKLFISDTNSDSLAVPTYINYHLITEPQLFDVEQGSTGTYRVFMHNTTNSRYSKIVVTGLPTGSTVVSDSCSAGLASGADCQIDYKFSKVSKLGEYNVKITAYPSNGSAPKEFDTGDLSVRINDSW